MKKSEVVRKHEMTNGQMIASNLIFSCNFFSIWSFILVFIRSNEEIFLNPEQFPKL